MKKLTLLLVSFFAVFALGLTGCSDDPDVKQETPVIKASNPADIAAVAGKVTVPYTVDYAVDGCSLDVTWDATWLHDLSSVQINSLFRQTPIRVLRGKLNSR